MPSQDKLYQKYIDTLQQVLFSIYNDLCKKYENPAEIRKTVYNIGQSALKEFGAIDPFEEKIDELIFLFNNGTEQVRKQSMEKLKQINQVLEIIYDKDESGETK